MDIIGQHPSAKAMVRTLKTEDSLEDLKLDLVWCMVTIVITTVFAFCIGHDVFDPTSPAAIMWAGALSAIIYMQFITLVVCALSYFSKEVRCYRASLIALAVTLTYVIAKIVAIPEPTDPMYSYSASLTALVVIGIKLKEVGIILKDNIRRIELVRS